MNGSEYQKRQDGNATVFDVTPAPHPKWPYMIGMGSLALLFGLITLPIGIVLMGIGAVGVWFGAVRDLRPPSHQVKNTFRVTPDTIESNGRTFNKDDISRLIIKNGITNQMVIIPLASGSMAAGVNFRLRVATVANGLEVEAGGKGHVLAGGLDETTAFGLLHDVSKVIGLSISRP